MRTPTPAAALYRWQAAALRGERPPVFEDEPQCGWFRTRLIANGPWVPAVITCHQPIDPETGELTEDERLIARIGREREQDARRVWVRLAGKPITEDAYHDLMHRLIHGSPRERATHAPVDLLDMFRS